MCFSLVKIRKILAVKFSVKISWAPFWSFLTKKRQTNPRKRQKRPFFDFMSKRVKNPENRNFGRFLAEKSVKKRPGPEFELGHNQPKTLKNSDFLAENLSGNFP